MTLEDTDVLEELAGLPSFHHPTASPDGGEVALYYDVSGRNELHFVDTGTGEMRQVSDGEVPRNARWYLKWSADGERIFYHDDEGGDEQNDVCAIDRDGETEPVVELDGQTVLSDVGEDGETLLVASTESGQMNLYHHDLAFGETTQITDYERATGSGILSPDCERVAYTTNESDEFANVDVYVANADGSDPRNLDVGETGAEARAADWGPDGDRLLVGDNAENFERCGVYDLDADSVTWFGDLDADEEPVTFLPGGDRFLAKRTRNAAVVPVVYDVETGEGRELDLPEGVAAVSKSGRTNPVVDDDRILVIHTTPDSRPELLVYDLETDEYETLVEAEYGEFDPDRFADAEYFTFESHDGLDIGALLYDSGERPSPLVVNPHGGPRHSDKLSWDLYTQFLVSRGYSVLQVNYRGSTGRGREFVERLYDDWGGGEQDDVAEATRQLAAEDWVDEDRIVVFGGSYGGYSAYWQMVRYPELYAAGIAWIGVTDLEDMYENTMPHYRTELMEKYLGTPAENPDLYRERSPIEYVENLDAPLLMVHGVNDSRVPVSQARLFRDALLDEGFEQDEDGIFEYVELGEEGHASSDIDQKIRLFRTLDDFLGRRLPEATASAEQ
ncbi:prolyl oligopeptidase family serine peptidase (plasmid) [Halorussus limi]|uniref:Prolyl oligopeptidase family serine peptidase n=1 Tax=Halorussus limi TaxID=2938695 RepID=A0A8U0I1B1_9EURY|nr:prolyl oligopeptidase family serine peptidase [Halorussus limi]UPV76544.1 prolyl oligopeptidase family serine peptidase [Halorussus limi]